MLPEANLQDEIEEEERRNEPALARYVRRHHALDQIIRNKDSQIMIGKWLRSDACVLCEFEPKLVKDALDNDH